MIVSGLLVYKPAINASLSVSSPAIMASSSTEPIFFGAYNPTLIPDGNSFAISPGL
jgi:hypothetical protein